MKILAVIPARGGSKGIPRKNVRLMNGRPLISYCIENAKSCELITDIVVTTDDEEVISIAQLHNVYYVVRDAEMAGDTVTLDPVVYDAVCRMEMLKNTKYEVVVTLQATSPLLRGTTLNDALESFLTEKKDTYISVVNQPQLSWSKDEVGFRPNYKERLNRQQLPAHYLETGAFLITKREFVMPNSRIGYNVSVFEVPEDESVDIDTIKDWIVSEKALRKKRVVFRADGYKEMGMGHIYHVLTIAYNLVGHEVLFVTRDQYTDGVNKLKASHMPFKLIKNDEDFFEFLWQWKADVVVNDCLDTDAEYIKTLKKLVKRVITIEDLGEGARYADAVINALYSEARPTANLYSGERYVCLRDEFLINQPREFSCEVNNVLVIFGGTDPGNFTKRLYNLAQKWNECYPGITFNFITGSGYDCDKNGICTIEDKKIYIRHDVKRVSDYMKNADIAFTSQGRTVFELTSLGIPSLVLAQNEREQQHKFAQMQNGFLNLGLGKDILDETIEATFKWLVDTQQIRYEMRSLMLKHDLKKGIKLVTDIILAEE